MADELDELDEDGPDGEPRETRALRRALRAEDIRELWVEVRQWRKWVHKLRNEVQVAVLLKDKLEKLEEKLDARAEVTHSSLGSLNVKLTEVGTVKEDFRRYVDCLEREARDKKLADAEAAKQAEERAKEKRTHRRWMIGILFALVTVLLQWGLRQLG